MQPNYSSVSNNALLLGNVLSSMGYVWSQGPREALPPNISFFGVAFTEPQWYCGIFVHEGEATLRVYANLCPANAVERVRVLEALNYINYHFMLDFMVELNLDANVVRLRTSVRQPGPIFRAEELRIQFENIFAAGRYWAEVMPVVLQSPRPVAEAIGETRILVRQRLGIPHGASTPNL